LDPDTIKRCIEELIENAEKAINGTGHVSITLTIEPPQRSLFYINSPVGDGTPYACISVKDDGIGMDTDVMDHMFEPYFTTQEFGKSAGIGLAVVYGCVHQQHGVIGVESSPGAGTTIKLYFPLEQIELCVQPK
jgi:signal transduction histidine kinase